jgi:hypothetical protein
VVAREKHKALRDEIAELENYHKEQLSLLAELD